MKVKNKGLSLVAAILLALAMAVTPSSLARADDDEAPEVSSTVAVQAVADESEEAVDKTTDAAEAAAQAAAEVEKAEEAARAAAEAEKARAEATDAAQAAEATQTATDTDTDADAAAQAAAEAEKARAEATDAAQAAPDETAAATEGDTTATDADAATGGEGETIYPLPSVTTSFDGPGKGSVTFVFQNPNENQQWFSAWLTPGAGVEVDCATIDLSHQGSVCSTSVLRTAITVPGQSSGTLVVPLDLVGYGPWGIDVLTFDPWGETGVEGGLAIRSAPDQASSFVVIAEVKDGQIVARFDLSQEYADAAYFNWVVNPQQGVTWVDCTAATHVYACGVGASGDVWVASGQPATVTLVADAESGPVTVSGWVQRPGLNEQEPWTFTVQVPAPTTPTTPTSPSSPPSSPSTPDPTTPTSPSSTPPSTTPPESPTAPPTSAPSAPATSDGAKSARSAGHARQHQDNVVEGAAAAAPDATSGDEAGAPASSQLNLPETGGPGTGPSSPNPVAAVMLTGALLVAILGLRPRTRHTH